MVRYAECEEYLLKYLFDIANDFRCAVGLILGQTSLQKYHVIHFAKTPPFQNDDDKNTEKPTENLKNVSEIHESWLADHARQTTRMLPGGMHVLGIFMVCDEDILNPFSSKLKSILTVINKTLSSQNYLFGSNNNEKLVLHYSSKTNKYLAKTYDVVTSNVQPTDFKFLQKTNKWVNFECTYQIDHVYYLKGNETEGPLKKHIKVILDDINRNLDTGIIIFDNEFKDLDERIENISKKKKVSRGSSIKSSNDSDNAPIQVSIFEISESSNVPEKLELVNFGGQLRIVGEVVCKLWINSKVTIGESVQAVKEDIMRSLATRLEMHWDSLTEEELGEEINSVHEPPRRVLIILPDSNITISDYLFPGEGPEEAKASLEELLDIKTNGPLNVMDVEGQADISQYYQETISTETENELPNITTDSNKFMYLLGLSAAIFILVISIVVHFGMKG